MDTPSESGFSILEALVALTIFALAAGAFYQGLGMGFRGVRAVQWDAGALAVASTAIASAGVETPLAEGIQSGTSPGGFSWTTDIRRYTNPDETLDDRQTAAYWVVVHVEWRESPAQRLQSFELKTLKLAADGPMMAPLQHQNRSGPDAGFALIEALVSLILLATILTLLPGTIRSAKRAWQAADNQSDAANLSSAMSVIESRLQSAMPVFERDQTGLPRLAFSGRAGTVSFVAPLRDAPARGGLYRLTLTNQIGLPSRTRAVAVINLQPFGRAGVPDAPPEQTDILPSLRPLSFRYFGADPKSGELVWAPEWRRTDRLPTLVEISEQAMGATGRMQMIRRVELKLASQ